MKPWHEATTEERKAFVKSGAKVADLMREYLQPDWCNYPEALSWSMGCWSLCDEETKVSYEFCKTCTESKHYEAEKLH